jgi:hypothetical protein
MTIARMTGVHKKEQIVGKMMDDIRRERCRSVAPEDVDDILEEVADEMQSSKIMFKELMDESIWSMTGVRPDKHPRDWKDMK